MGRKITARGKYKREHNRLSDSIVVLQSNTGASGIGKRTGSGASGSGASDSGASSSAASGSATSQMIDDIIA